MTTPAGTPASGQAPNAGTETGQAPIANNGGSPTTAPNPGQAPDGNTAPPTSGQQLTQADYDRMISELRRENASHRTENARVAAELKKFQDAQLTTEQKRDRDYSELQTKAQQYEQSLQRLNLENAGLRLAPTLGIADPGAALALVQAEHGAEVKYGADGKPENLDALLKQVVKDHPVLAAQATQPQRPPANSGGATNPGRSAGNGSLTMEQIKAMSPREAMRRVTEIDEWQKANPDLVAQWAREVNR